MKGEGRRTENRGRRMEDGGWNKQRRRMEDRGRRMEDGGWGTEDDGRQTDNWTNNERLKDEERMKKYGK